MTTQQPFTVGPADLGSALQHVRQRDAGPAFVGADSAPEAVVLSSGSYDALVASGAHARRRAAATEAIVSVRADAADPGPPGRAALGRYVAGVVSAEDAVAELVAHYRRS